MALPALLQPDLKIQSITWAEHATTPGAFTYTVVVENVGAGKAIPLRERQLGIRVSVQGYVYSFDIIDTETDPSGFYRIAPGGRVTFTFDVDDSEPSFVKVVVDIVDWPSTTPFGSAAYDNFIESDEENNEVTVPGPV